MPWARATAGIRCSSRDGQVAQDVLVTGEPCLPTWGMVLDGAGCCSLFPGLHPLPRATPRPPPSCSHKPRCLPLRPHAATVVTGQINGYLSTLEHLARYGCFPRPPTHTTASGQTVVDVFPTVSGWFFLCRQI